jgi:hypothetical protein
MPKEMKPVECGMWVLYPDGQLKKDGLPTGQVAELEKFLFHEVDRLRREKDEANRRVRQLEEDIVSIGEALDPDAVDEHPLETAYRLKKTFGKPQMDEAMWKRLESLGISDYPEDTWDSFLYRLVEVLEITASERAAFEDDRRCLCPLGHSTCDPGACDECDGRPVWKEVLVGQGKFQVPNVRRLKIDDGYLYEVQNIGAVFVPDRE